MTKTYGSLVENMEIMNCPKRISLKMQKAQSPQEDSPLPAGKFYTPIRLGPC